MKQKFVLITIMLCTQTLMGIISSSFYIQGDDKMIAALIVCISFVVSLYVVWNILKME